MISDSGDNIYGMYPRPAVTCDSRDDTGFNWELELHRVDRGVTAMRRESGRAGVAAAQAGEHQASVQRLTAMAFNGGPLPETAGR